eukprot:gene5673-6369_t
MALAAASVKSEVSSPKKTSGHKTFIQRDFTLGTAVRFQEKFPLELDGRLPEAQFDATIKHINSIFDEAEKGGLCMKKLAHYINEQNESVYVPRGLMIVNPMERGLRVECFMEILARCIKKCWRPKDKNVGIDSNDNFRPRGSRRASQMFENETPESGEEGETDRLDEVDLKDVYGLFVTEEQEAWQRNLNSLLLRMRGDQTSRETSSHSSPAPDGSSTAESSEGSIGKQIFRHGASTEEIHQFFFKLDSKRCCLPLDQNPQPRISSTGTLRTVQAARPLQPRQVSSASEFLNEKERGLYQRALHCANYPVLCSPSSEPPVVTPSVVSAARKVSNSSRSSSIPSDANCLMSPTDATPIDVDIMMKLLRESFGINHRVHERYYMEMKKSIPNRDPSKLLLQELQERLYRLETNSDNYYKLHSFVHPDGYAKWRTRQISNTRALIQRFWKKDMTRNLGMGVQQVDAHKQYLALQNKLFEDTMRNRRELNLDSQDDHSSSIFPLSTAARKLLKEFGLRYGVCSLFRQIATLVCIAEKFENTSWFIKIATRAVFHVDKILQNGDIMVEDERKMLEHALDLLHRNIEYTFKKIRKLCPSKIQFDTISWILEMLNAVIQLKEDLGVLDENATPINSLVRGYFEYIRCITVSTINMVAVHEDYDKCKDVAMIDNINPYTNGPTAKSLITILHDMKRELKFYEEVGRKCIDLNKYFNVTFVAANKLYELYMKDIKELIVYRSQSIVTSEIDVEVLRLVYRLAKLDADWANYIHPSTQKWRTYFMLEMHVIMTITSEFSLRQVRSFVVKDNWATMSFKEDKHDDVRMGHDATQHAGASNHFSRPVNSSPIVPSARSAFTSRPVSKSSAAGSLAVDCGDQSTDGRTGCSNEPVSREASPKQKIKRVVERNLGAARDCSSVAMGYKESDCVPDTTRSSVAVGCEESDRVPDTTRSSIAVECEESDRVTDTTHSSIAVECEESDHVTDTTGSSIAVECEESDRVTDTTGSSVAVECEESDRVTDTTGSSIAVECEESDRVTDTTGSSVAVGYEESDRVTDNTGSSVAVGYEESDCVTDTTRSSFAVGCEESACVTGTTRNANQRASKASGKIDESCCDPQIDRGERNGPCRLVIDKKTDVFMRGILDDLLLQVGRIEDANAELSEFLLIKGKKRTLRRSKNKTVNEDENSLHENQMFFGKVGDCEQYDSKASVLQNGRQFFTNRRAVFYCNSTSSEDSTICPSTLSDVNRHIEEIESDADVHSLMRKSRSASFPNITSSVRMCKGNAINSMPVPNGSHRLKSGTLSTKSFSAPACGFVSLRQKASREDLSRLKSRSDDGGLDGFMSVEDLDDVFLEDDGVTEHRQPAASSTKHSTGDGQFSTIADGNGREDVDFIPVGGFLENEATTPERVRKSGSSTENTAEDQTKKVIYASSLSSDLESAKLQTNASSSNESIKEQQPELFELPKEGRIVVSSSLVDVLTIIQRIGGFYRELCNTLAPVMACTSNAKLGEPKSQSEMTRENFALRFVMNINDILTTYGEALLSLDLCGLDDETIVDILGSELYDKLKHKQNNGLISGCRHDPQRRLSLQAAEQGNFSDFCPKQFKIIKYCIGEWERLDPEICTRINNTRSLIELISLIEDHTKLVCFGPDKENQQSRLGGNETQGLCQALVTCRRNLRLIWLSQARILAYRLAYMMDRIVGILMSLSLKWTVNAPYKVQMRPISVFLEHQMRILRENLRPVSIQAVVKALWQPIILMFHDYAKELRVNRADPEHQSERFIQLMSVLLTHLVVDKETGDDLASRCRAALIRFRLHSMSSEKLQLISEIARVLESDPVNLHRSLTTKEVLLDLRASGLLPKNFSGQQFIDILMNNSVRLKELCNSLGLKNRGDVRELAISVGQRLFESRLITCVETPTERQEPDVRLAVTPPSHGHRPIRIDGRIFNFQNSPDENLENINEFDDRESFHATEDYIYTVCRRYCKESDLLVEVLHVFRQASATGTEFAHVLLADVVSVLEYRAFWKRDKNSENILKIVSPNSRRSKALSCLCF